MKYIRTKDGVYRRMLFNPIGLVRIDKRDGTYPDIEYHEILAESDTIEELIDKYVIKNPENNCLDILDSLGIINIQLFNESNLIVYGAIWTDKGLIYVAKMNEKGDLELL